MLSPAQEMYRQKFGTTIDQNQIVDQVLFDKLLYTSAVTTALNFFQRVPATPDLGNMEVAGVLPSPKAFIIRAIRMHIQVAPALVAAGVPNVATDINLLINNGTCELVIGNKQFNISPMYVFPGGAGVYADGAGANSNYLVTMASNGVPDPRSIYTLSFPLMIEPQVNFRFTARWPAAQTLTANCNITAIFDGQMMLAVQ